MTSNENNKETVEFLENHNYFGYNKNFCHIFKQDELPMLSKEGKLIVGKDKIVREAANGNGSVFKCMFKDGILDEMQKKGILAVEAMRIFFR